MMGQENGEKIPREIRFMKSVFREYYRDRPVEPPYRFTRREWGFFPFGGKMMFRHIGFQRRSEIDDFFVETAPMHAYYSTAYYGDPALQPMGDKFKTWMGADLIFDLDADHLPNADEMSYREQLEKVKEEVGRLLFDFILDDLGLPLEHTHLHFSGGRGYHVHVRAPEVLQLDSRDRRAIVDYITGRNFDWGQITFDTLRADAGGWRGKIARGLIDNFEPLRGMTKKEATKVLKDTFGVGKGTAEKLYAKRDGIVLHLKGLDSDAKVEYIKSTHPELGTEELRDLVEREGVLDGDFLADRWERVVPGRDTCHMARQRSGTRGLCPFLDSGRAARMIGDGSGPVF